jgi:hypothetical protein
MFITYTKEGACFLFRGNVFFHHLIKIVFLISAFSSAYCGASSDQISPRNNNELVQQSSRQSESVNRQNANPPHEIAAQTQPHERQERTEPSRAEQVMKAIAKAYPPQIAGPAIFQNGDWTVTIRGETFYFAEGRMLPENLKDKYAEYDAQPFYRYIEKLPQWKPASEEENASRRNSANRRNENPPKRAPFFFDALFRASSRDESYLHVKTLKFLGRNVMVHYSILEQLALVEEEINRVAQNSAEVRSWIANIKSVTGWNWRSIADTQSRSFHSYGTAIDILPVSNKGLATYWLWTADWNPEWWNVPYSQRFHPPEAVVQSFEKYGFTWGGKWALFDTMHFEYRPEILDLSTLKMAEYY